MIAALACLLAAVAVAFALRERRAAACVRAAEHRLRALAASGTELGTELLDREQRLALLEQERHFLSAVLAQMGDRVRVADAGGRLLAFDGSSPAAEPGSTDPRGASPPYARPLADRPGPEGVTLRVPGRSTMDRAYGAEASTDHRWIRAELHPLEWAEHFGLAHPDGTPFGPHETPLLRALRGEPVDGVEVHVDGRALVEVGGPVLGPDGERLGAVVVNADLTDFRNAETRLRRSEERHRRVVESVSDCVFETDATGVWTHLSDAWTHATGFTVEDSLGRQCSEFVHPDDRVAHARALAPLMGGERVALRHEHRFLTASGVARWGEVQVRAISGWDGLPIGFAGVMRDVTGERRAAQHGAAEQAVMRLLIAMDGLEDAGPGVLEILGRELGWDGAELWRMAGDEHLRRTAGWVAPGVSLDRFMGAGVDLGYEVGDGFPGQAWMSRVPLWTADDSLRLAEARAEGIRSTVALPLRAAGGPVGVIVLVSRTPREPEPGLERLLEAIGGHLTQFQRRREAEGRAAAQAADLKALAAVAHELAGETDLFAARNTLCRAVRSLTDSASVVLFEPSGRDALGVSAALGAAVNGLDVDLDPRSISAEAYLSCEIVFVGEVAGYPRAARCAAVAGAASAAWVPVVRDGRGVGVLAVGWSERRGELSERDHELLRLLAAEAAITIHRTDLLARLQSTARTDPLTSLPNRRVWDEDLARELARARRHSGTVCLAMLDLDRFKAYNDAFGHQAGDELLAAAASAWRPELRATDTIARLGGEEFAVLLPHSDEAGALAVVERLLAVVPFDQTCSAGVAVWDGSESGEALLARADAALYRAKHAGRARALLASAV